MYPSLGTWLFPVYTYGVLLAVAFLSGILYAYFHASYFGISKEEVIDLALWFMISAMLGARVLYIILFPGQFPTLWSWVSLNKGGLVFFGGFLATTCTVLFLVWKNNMNLRDWGDLIAPSLALGQCFGRLGCFSNGCCYGRQTDFALGMVFPNLHDDVVRHPTQLYEAAFHFLLVLFFSYGIRVRSGHPLFFRGFFWGIYLLGYGAFRFMIEFIRDDDRGGVFLPLHLSISQIIALAAFAAGLFWMIGCYRLHRSERNPEVSLAQNR